MAGIAFGAVSALMNIMNFMTTDTLFRCVFVFLIDVARRAICLLVSTFQRKVGLFVVIKCRLLPSRGGMAIAAFFAVLAVVNIRSFMATVAIPWCFMILFVGFVAAATAGFCMNTLEPKIGFIMIEG
jgi:hypothetical protein